MADAAEVVRGRPRASPASPSWRWRPNLKGVQRAAEAGAHKITMPVSASEAHSRANINMTCEQAIAEVGARLPLPRRPARGAAAGGRGRRLHRLRLHDPGRGAGGLGDRDGGAPRAARAPTASACRTPSATPTRRRSSACSSACAPSWARRRAAPTCTTRAARASPTSSRRWRSGVTTFDASQGGIGGCPYAPGRHRQHRHRGPGLHARGHGPRHGRRPRRSSPPRGRSLEEGLPGEPVYGHLPDVGAEKGFRYAARGPAPEGTGKTHRGTPACEVVA